MDSNRRFNPLESFRILEHLGPFLRPNSLAATAWLLYLIAILNLVALFHLIKKNAEHLSLKLNHSHLGFVIETQCIYLLK